MRERITYIQKLGDSLEPSALSTNGRSITGPDVNAVREDRLTFALHELPSELQALLAGVQDLHIRWESFTSLPNDGLQYFQQLESLSHFIQYAKEQLCRTTDTSCSARLDDLSKAATLDISYDAPLNVLKVTALWPYQRQSVQATSRLGIRTEVGILSNDNPKTLERHELGISGLLTVLGPDSTPLTNDFLTPTGLHPTLQLRLSSPTPPPLASSDDSDAICFPYAYFTLPRTIFADKYQLADPLFLASKNLTSLRYTTDPVDLEAPEYVMPQWGSSILVQLVPPTTPSPSSSSEKRVKQEPEWTAQIPLHLRYLTPAPGGYSTIEVPYPAVFWACEPEEGEGMEFPPSPFEKGRVGYDGLFEQGTVFWHVEPKPVEGDNRLVNQVRVPVLDLDKAGWVNAGTAAAVLLGFAWVVWKLGGVWWREGMLRGGWEEGVKKRQ
ncbi:protease B nonderepressible form [Collariella sp. IMI 366227]|nr:protease B nonderepressible form [Collariella sp. IMI 366227]